MRRSLLTTVLLLATLAPASVWTQQNVVSQESNLNTSNGVLSGTFLVPDLPTPMPVVLIVAGSGPTDRDGNSTMLQGKNNAYRLLAEALAARGIASLRYDKRGVGKSAKVGQKEADLRFEDYVNDAANIADILRGDARFSTVTIAGHSEGSLIGMIAARVSEADAFVSIAGVAQGAAGIIRAQLQPQLGSVPALWDASQAVLASLEAGQTIAPPPALAGVPGLASLFRPSVQPYLISWFKYVPTAEIAKLTVPVLLIQGETDMQVSVAEAEALKAAAPKATVAIVPGMNHVMKAVVADAGKQVASYGDPSLPIVPAVPDVIAGLIRGLPKRPAPASR